MQQLDDRDRQILDFEAQRWRYAGVKEAQIRERFGWSATRYFQVLNHLLDQAAAEAYAPALVHRLRRQRDARIGARSNARRLGWTG